ncbi:hypothetical protein [Natronorubrum sp. DTA28]|uniref:hypothetical protein n=1 Tax=Natronorubrum sp. DTA28 TaxID=3447019 RepID=UPI003F834F2E
MKRRTLLAAVGSGTVVSTGCLGSSDDIVADEPRDDVDAPRAEAADGTPETTCDATGSYEMCGRLLISDDSFPNPVRCEIDAALEADGYTATGRFLLEDAMNVEHAYVRRDATSVWYRTTAGARRPSNRGWASPSSSTGSSSVRSSQ